MIVAGADQCPICALRSWECQHDAVRWSKVSGKFERCPLAEQAASSARTAEQVLARARSLRVVPRTSELVNLYLEWVKVEPVDDDGPHCVAWLLELARSWPTVGASEDDERIILWTTDLSSIRDRLADLRTRLEVEFCAHPGDLRMVTSRS